MESNFEEVLPKLVKIQLFEDFDLNNENDVKSLKTVYENMSLKSFKKNEVIIREGEVGDEFYILISGSVHISRKTPAGDVIALADLNDTMNIFFGETALISDDTRTATVSALTDCKVIVLTSKNFHALCKNDPVLGYRVLTVLARRMMKTIRDVNKDKATLYEALFNEVAGGDGM